jgi:hypothetical protein
MKTLELRPIPPIILDNCIRFSCQLIRRSAEETENISELWYEILKESDISWKDEDVEPYLIATLLLAMQEGRNIVAKGTVSGELLSNLTEFSDFWNNCLPELFKKVDIVCENIENHRSNRPMNKAVAAFSGGLDATFLLWRHITGQAGYRTQPLSGCAIIHGFDIPLSNEALFNASVARAKMTLETVGLPLVTIRTNVLEALPVDTIYSHGTALVSSLQFLKSKFDIALIASSDTYSQLAIPWGSSPLTDHLLSSSRLKVLHDGAGYSRSLKVKFVTEWNEGISNLRVCWNRDDISILNCGKCEKCIRTMACFAVNRLPIPKCLNGNLNVLNTRIKSLKLLTLIQKAEWISLVKEAKQNNICDRWVKWGRWLIMRYKIKQIRKSLKYFTRSIFRSHT